MSPKNQMLTRRFTLQILLFLSTLSLLAYSIGYAQIPTALTLKSSVPAQGQSFLPIIFVGEDDSVEPLLDRLLATGQTIGYQGNVGTPASGNRDDGDLLRGRAQDYEYVDVDTPTTQVENLIIDRNTGLMWIRDVSVMSGDDAAGVAGNIALNETYDWESAIERANTLVYAGFEDWRLPNLKEMQTLVDYGTSEPSIDTTAFPLAYEEYVSNYFWTSTTFAVESDNAFYTNFLNGHTFRFAKTTPFALRPVRSVVLDDPVALLQTGQTTVYVSGDDGDLQQGVAQQFEYADDGLIDSAAENVASDLNTDLMWVRDPLLLPDFAEPHDWQGSIDRVNQLEYGGYDDWRMPNIVELESIFQAGDAVDVLDPVIFPNKPVDPDDMEAVIWWSSTTSAYDKDANTLGKDSAWYTTSAIGTTNFGNSPNTNANPVKLRPGYVRPVRDVNPPVQSSTDFLDAVRSPADFALMTQASSRPDLLAEGKFMLLFQRCLRGFACRPFESAFQNVKRYPLHYEFLRDALSIYFPGLTAPQYTALVTRRESREFWAGGLRSFMDEAGQLTYGFDIYTDPSDEGELLTQQETAAVYARLAEVFTLRPLVYSPTRQSAIDQAQSWLDPDFAIGFPSAATAPDYEAYTLGQTYGTVRIMTLAEMEAAATAGQLSRQEIIVIDGTPTDLESIVAGIVTGERQGDLTHLNVRTARRGTPNAYIKDGREKLAAYAGQLVRLSVSRADYLVETDVPLAAAESWWNASRPPTVTVRAPEYSYRSIDNFPAISSNDLNGSATTRFGGKAANLARLYAFLPSPYQVRGFAIPFAYYADFMRTNTMSTGSNGAGETYADYIAGLHQDPTFRGDSVARAQMLDAFRTEMRANGVVSPTLVAELVGRVDQVFGEGTKVRFRSSSNAEDGLAFNGAGLYDSTSVCVLDTTDDDEIGPSRCDPNKLKERTIERALKKLWASQWNFRAWEERDYYGIEHLDSAMAVLVTTAFPDERANGVAFTGDPSRVGGVAANNGLAEYLINVQAGDLSVVLPDPGVVPERDQLTVQDGEVTQIARVRGSSEVAAGERVMSDAELTTLGEVMALADAQFPLALGTHDRSDVLLDFEFKIRREDDQLLIKQVRPFLTREPNSGAQSALLRVHTLQSIDLCGGWRESAGLQTELLEKARLTLPAGDLETPLGEDAVDNSGLTHTLFDALEFGYPLTTIVAADAGMVAVERSGGDDDLRVTLTRSYTDGDRAVEIALAFSSLRIGEFALRRLDQSNLASAAKVTGVVRDTATDQLLARVQFVPCALDQLPLIEFDVALENGQRLKLQQRRERDDGVTGLAALISAEVTLVDATGALLTQTVDDYARLVYAAERHHWNEEFWVLLDPPIGDAHAIRLSRAYTGGESVYSAELAGASLDLLRAVGIESVVRE